LFPFIEAMKDKFERYMARLSAATEPRHGWETAEDRVPGTRRPSTALTWSFEHVRKQFKQWRRDTRRNHVWVIVRGGQAGQSRTKHAPHTKVGCSSDLRGCLLENAQKLHGSSAGGGGGGGRGKKKDTANGAQATSNGNVCKMAICLGVPPSRNFSATALEAGCTNGKGFIRRCNNTLVQGLLYGLDCSISSELLEPEGALYVQEVAQVLANIPFVSYGSTAAEP
jgi:hypothetical protein